MTAGSCLHTQPELWDGPSRLRAGGSGAGDGFSRKGSFSLPRAVPAQATRRASSAAAVGTCLPLWAARVDLRLFLRSGTRKTRFPVSLLRLGAMASAAQEFLPCAPHSLIGFCPGHRIWGSIRTFPSPSLWRKLSAPTTASAAPGAAAQGRGVVSPP